TTCRAIGDALERRVRGQSGAHVGAGQRGGQRGMIEEIAWVRDQHVRREATVDGDAEMTRCRADILLASFTRAALATADPRIHRDRAVQHDVLRVRASALDASGDLVAEREWKLTTAGYVQSLVGAELEIPILHMQVRMTHAAALDPHKHLGALRLRAIRDGLA